MKKRMLVLLASLLFLLIAVLAWQVQAYSTFKRQPIAIGQQSITYLIPQGASLKKVAWQLESDGVLSNRYYFALMARLAGNAHRIQAGEYELIPGMTPIELLERLVDGKVYQHSLTIVEGWTYKQMLEAMHAHDALVHDVGSFSMAEIAERIGLSGMHLEGQFLPDTYFFPRGTRETAFMKRAHLALQRVLDSAWEKRQEKLPYKTPYDALILASVIEKETGVASERRQIAGVFVRRLQKKMKLQSDPTIIYGLGDEYKGDIKYVHLRTDTPYNTYTRKGLPPTPIALPGQAAIEAALNPAAGTYLYFVAQGDGTHFFSSDFKTHQRAVDQYQRKRK